MQDLFAVKYSFLIPLLPLLGAAIAGFFGARWLKGKSHWPIWLGVGASAILSISLLFSMIGLTRGLESHKPEHGVFQAQPTVGVNHIFYQWISAGDSQAAGTNRFLDVSAGFWFDPLTAVMLCVVCGIGFLITVFAAGYMKGEEGYFRFFAYLGLFIFAMCCLVMGNNLIMLYLGWEGVGLCSYLLIGYYYEKPAAREAAKKAFLVNRIGDFGFGLGIMLCFMAFGTVTYFGDGNQLGLLELAQNNLQNASNFTPFQQSAMQWIPFLLMLGAFGKSAQFPLHVWLPDAMEGPTPVSALIHAATMVTAGVYMIARCGTLFVGNAAAMTTIVVIGLLTALLGATIAMRQFDLKKVFAYSTISQLGFMFVAVGALAPVAAVFHLVTHAFFKALLFLSSGVVMHAMAGELDMRKFSGLKKQLPTTRWLMLIGCAALAGFPLTSGFFSKDEVAIGAWIRSPVAGGLILLTAFITAYYTFRLYFRVFEGPEVLPATPGHGHAPDHAAASHSAIAAGDARQSGVDTHLATDTTHHGQAVHDHAHAGHPHTGHGHGAADHHHNHEPSVMIVPLVVLAFGALFAGALAYHHSLANFLGYSPSFKLAFDQAARFRVESQPIVRPLAFGNHMAQEQLEAENRDLVEQDHRLHLMMMIGSGLISLAGIGLAYHLHLKDRRKAEEIAARYPGTIRVLEAKYWFDEIYQAGIVEPLRSVGRLFFAMDRIVVDGLVWMISFIPQASGFALKLTTQRGYLQGYAVTMLLGVAVILMFMFL